MPLTLKGEQREFENGLSLLDIAGKISQQLKKDALCARVDGQIMEMWRTLDHDCEVEFLTFADEAGRWTLRHTASHVLAQAVKALYPDAKLAIGPAIDNGFYYDFDVGVLYQRIFWKIEKEMKKLIQQNESLERFELPRAEAIAFMKEKGEDYKVELIEDLPEDAVISFYKQGDFVDLCAGPHLPSTGRIKAVKLMSTAGAYWRGDEHNKMLKRIYGTAFEKQAELEEYVKQQEEARTATTTSWAGS
ncbi:MAG: TGS domain-containing protein [Christensenellales bacterium]